eukprot:scaffold7601_cov267-Pinguiococcus_pyrenoidosus.AAC.1
MRLLSAFLVLALSSAFPRAQVRRFQSPRLQRGLELQMAKIGRGAAEVEGSGKVAVLTKTRVVRFSLLSGVDDV